MMCLSFIVLKTVQYLLVLSYGACCGAQQVVFSCCQGGRREDMVADRAKAKQAASVSLHISLYMGLVSAICCLHLLFSFLCGPNL